MTDLSEKYKDAYMAGVIHSIQQTRKLFGVDR